MDPSVAGRAHSMQYMDGWTKPAPVLSPTIIAPVQSVRASEDSKRLRDRHKDRSGDGAASKTEEPPDDPGALLPPAYLALQSIDPDTDYVFWQAPSPTDRLAGPLGPGGRGSNTKVHARLTGLLGKRAYEKRLSGRREFPRITRTA